eukprot:4440903-Prorocentrum_lima.AAC.1
MLDGAQAEPGGLAPVHEPELDGLVRAAGHGERGVRRDRDGIHTTPVPREGRRGRPELFIEVHVPNLAGAVPAASQDEA